MGMTNDEAVLAMRSHHTALAAGLQERVDAVTEAVRAGSGQAAAVHDTVAYLEREILPHARAEEDAVYPLAARRPELSRLVDAMIVEHRHLAGAVEELSGTEDGLGAVGLGQAISSLFGLHAEKENEYILPALASDPGVSLAGVVERMHALLGGGGS